MKVVDFANGIVHSVAVAPADLAVNPTEDAFNRYGFSEQIPNRLYVYNNRLSGRRTVGSTEMLLIKVADDRLGDTETFTTPDGIEVWFSSRLRTLVDAVYDWNRFGTLPQAYWWITAELDARPDSVKEIVRLVLKYGNIGTRRRIGKCLEDYGVDIRQQNRLLKSLPITTALIPMVPDRPKRGSVDRRWAVQDNRLDNRDEEEPCPPSDCPTRHAVSPDGGHRDFHGPGGEISFGSHHGNRHGDRYRYGQSTDRGHRR